MIKFLFFLFVGLPAGLIAQYKNIFDTSLINNTSDNFFCINPAVNSIKVHGGYRGSKSLSVFVKSFDQDSSLQKRKQVITSIMILISWEINIYLRKSTVSVNA